MNLFLADFSDHSQQAVLQHQEAYHCVRVLRMKPGDKLHITNGKGYCAEGILRTATQSECLIDISGKIEQASLNPYYLHIAIALPKSADRMEWFVEKSVELGIDEITPLICSRSERKKYNHDRLVKTAVSAMKQSLRAYLPVIHPATSFNEFVKISHSMLKTICTQSGETGFEKFAAENSNVLAMIGPEGDFTVEELSQAIGSGFQPVHLGQARLRTETAGLYICSSMKSLVH